MAPEGSEPLHMALHLRITGEIVQGSGDVFTTHLPQAPEQIARVIEHDPRIAALADQLRDQIRHTSITLSKWFGIVVISLPRMLNHVLKV